MVWRSAERPSEDGGGEEGGPSGQVEEKAKRPADVVA